MKNFQQNLLIILALALCGLCAYQWYEQAFQRSEIESLNRTVLEKSESIRDCTNSMAAMSRQLVEMDARISELKNESKTNAQLAASEKRELTHLQFTSETLTNQLAEYKKAVDALSEKLKTAYDGINKQNETITNLVAQRDEFVQKYNDSVKDRNNIVAKYNALAAQLQKLQNGEK